MTTNWDHDVQGDIDRDDLADYCRANHTEPMLDCPECDLRETERRCAWCDTNLPDDATDHPECGEFANVVDGFDRPVN